jgi:hypothetical protein
VELLFLVLQTLAMAEALVLAQQVALVVQGIVLLHIGHKEKKQWHILQK